MYAYIQIKRKQLNTIFLCMKRRRERGREREKKIRHFVEASWKKLARRGKALHPWHLPTPGTIRQSQHMRLYFLVGRFQHVLRQCFNGADPFKRPEHGYL